MNEPLILIALKQILANQHILLGCGLPALTPADVETVELAKTNCLLVTNHKASPTT